MKRPGDPRPALSSPHSAVLPPTITERQTRPRTQDTEIRALTEALHDKVRHRPALQAAADLILSLSSPRWHHTAANGEGPVCQQAVDLLLELGHPELLCRLLHTQSDHVVLKVGANEQRAQALASVVASWPPRAAVSVQLSSAMSVAGMEAIGAFLRCTSLYGLHLVVDGQPDLTALDSLRDNLHKNLRPLPIWELSLSAGESPVTDAEVAALLGVQAQAIRIKLASNAHTAPQPSIDRLVALVQGSNATSLDLSDPSIPTALAQHLLSISPHWNRVVLGEQNSAAWKPGLPTIDQLHIPTLPFHAELLESLDDSKVKILITNSAVDLGSMSDELPANTSLQRIEASFFVKRDSDVDDLLDALRRDQRFIEMVDSPSTQQVAGFKRIDETSAARLSAWRMAKDGGASPLSSLSRSLVEKLDRTAAVSWALTGDYTVNELLERLSAMVDMLPGAHDLPGAVAKEEIDGLSTALDDKLQCLILAQMPDTMMRSILSRLLRIKSTPDTDEQVCQALIDIEHLQLAKNDTDWLRLGHAFATRWASDGLSVPGVDTAQLLDKIAPPLFQLPAKTRAVAPRPFVPGAVHTDDLVVPAGQPERLALIDRLLRAVPRAHRDFANITAARTAILRLLTDATTDPMEFLPGSRRNGLASELLDLGQWKLLQHVLQFRSEWDLPLDTPEAALALGQLTNWPDPDIACHLIVDAGLPLEAVRHMNDFASEGAPHTLSLTLKAAPAPHNDVATWRAWAAWIKAHPGLTLTLNFRHGAFPPDVVLALLNDIAPRVIGKLVLEHLNATPAVAQALAKAIRHTGVSQLALVECAGDLQPMVIADHPWAMLEVTLNHGLVEQARSGAVGTVRDRRQDRRPHGGSHAFFPPR
ncbi:hypothetical protein [Hydrogenophaga sp.]|uniref:hypothetical protein n=1 Tax=Hydrogenophaga sp. TaxID=1904254 RepID=UPI002725B638|nr:hypothetical protein [Hydrogenophaga sp.]MDO9434482.1 hypothetical protein [Hydrogenophaga sp.]